MFVAAHVGVYMFQDVLVCVAERGLTGLVVFVTAHPTNYCSMPVNYESSEYIRLLHTVKIAIDYQQPYGNLSLLWGSWLSGKGLDLRVWGLGFDSWHTGHV
jgi:hypothetical protein